LVDVNDNYDHQRWHHTTDDVVPLCSVRSWCKRALDRQNQVNTQTHVEHQRSQLKALEKEPVRPTQGICGALKRKIWRFDVTAPQSCPCEDFIHAEIAEPFHWVYDLDDCVVTHACFRHTDVGNEHLWVSLQFFIEDDGHRNEEQSTDRDKAHDSEDPHHHVALL